LKTFLRLFEWVRDMESALVSMEAENSQLRKQSEAMLEERCDLWNLVHDTLAKYDVAVANERAAYQMHVNHATQKMGGGIPYPDAHNLPPSAVPNPDPPKGGYGRRFVLPSEAVAQASERMIRKYVERRAAENHAPAEQAK
jgi:hypothetical protein